MTRRGARRRSPLASGVAGLALAAVAGLAPRLAAGAPQDAAPAAAPPAAVARWDGERALAWLRAAQAPDGRWTDDPARDGCAPRATAQGAGTSPTADVATTALGMLPFLEAGHTPRSQAPHGPVLAAAWKWLAARVGPDGRAVGDEGAARPEDHALATFALLRTWGLTGSPLHQGPAVRAWKALVALLDPDSPVAVPLDRHDHGAFAAWSVLALGDARLIGLDEARRGATATLAIPDAVAALVRRWGAGAADPIAPYLARRAAGLLVVGADPKGDRTILTAQKVLAGWAPPAAWWTEGPDAAVATFLLAHTDPPRWQAWHDAALRALTPRQATAATPCEGDGGVPAQGAAGTRAPGAARATAFAALVLATRPGDYDAVRFR